MSRAEKRVKLELDRIVFIGGTFEEHLDLFSLTAGILKGKKILDCPAGACSFTAVGIQHGIDVTECDIAYYHDQEDLKMKGYQDVDHSMIHREKAKDNYGWNYFKTIEELRENRLRAVNDCTNDMKE
ncbi:hypothetical protein KP78_17140 [Jeotgalibacillus soli]|uniref:Uncharacterized protein n=1 Tax=Jeotgalibacillus soli TaxID=889306 RepID=A0A0C2VHB6_9BACL|nr:hypothetical protein KP78_17140 [Jeotgalibacillus soli]